MKIDRCLARIQPLREGDDIEEYLIGLETELRQVDIPSEYWRSTLTSALTPAAKGLVQEYLADPSTTYDDIANDLQDAAGLDCNTAMDLLMNSMEPKARNSNPSAFVQNILKWVEKLHQVAKSLQDGKARLIIGKDRTRMTPAARSFLNTKSPQSKMELIQVLQEWKATVGGGNR